MVHRVNEYLGMEPTSLNAANENELREIVFFPPETAPVPGKREALIRKKKTGMGSRRRDQPLSQEAQLSVPGYSFAG